MTEQEHLCYRNLRKALEMLCDLAGDAESNLDRLKAASAHFKGLELRDASVADSDTYDLWSEADHEMGKLGQNDPTMITSMLVELALRVAVDSGKRVEVKWPEFLLNNAGAESDF